MSRNAGGTYSLPAVTAVAGATASSTTVNNNMNDIATELTDSLSRSGKGGMSAALDMGGFKVTNGAAGTAASDLSRLDQVQTGVVRAASAVAGTVDAIQVTFSPDNTAWTSRESFTFVSTGANTSTTPTISKDGGSTTKTIKKGASSPLVAGDIGPAGTVHEIYYNGTDAILRNPTATSISFASTTDVLTATDTTKAATSGAISALWTKAVDVASASTVTFGDGGYFHITGTTTITALACTTDKAGRSIRVRFAGALTLTHNATSLILPTGANITTAADDTAEFVSEGSGNFRCLSYQRANGSALTTASASGVMTFIGSGVVVGTATADHTSIGVFTSYVIRSTTYNTAGGTRNFQILFSSNNGSSFSTARNVAIAPATSVSTATGSATVRGVGASATNKVVTPQYVTVADIDTTPVISTYTTTDTETVVNGVINAVRFTNSGAVVTTSYEIYGVA